MFSARPMKSNVTVVKPIVVTLETGRVSRPPRGVNKISAIT